MDTMTLFPSDPPTGTSISALVRLGTSTWTYEGWQGQVYKRHHGKTTFARDCLGEYCQYLYQGQPLFRTVGNDSTFYGPPTPNQLRRYLSQIPESFEMWLASRTSAFSTRKCQLQPYRCLRIVSQQTKNLRARSHANTSIPILH